MNSYTPSDHDYQIAQQLLADGDVIGLPTETVYGLAGDATNPLALRRIFALKNRPTDHPLIVHLGDASWLPDYVRSVPERARRLAERFWPGPLTLILDRSSKVPDEVTGGLETVALRVPAHPVALRLLSQFGRPLAAPSANLFGQVSPTRASHVRSDFGARLSFVLDGGPCQVGVESTILDVRREPRLLRPGGLSRSDIESFLGSPVAVGAAERDPVRAPGTLASHYAPRARLEVMSSAELARRTQVSVQELKMIGIFAPGLASASLATWGRFERESIERIAGAQSYRAELRASDDSKVDVILLTIPEAHENIAHSLYAALRSLDEAGCDAIWAVVPEAGTLGEAVDDRLMRAASPRRERDG